MQYKIETLENNDKVSVAFRPSDGQWRRLEPAAHELAVVIIIVVATTAQTVITDAANLLPQICRAHKEAAEEEDSLHIQSASARQTRLLFMGEYEEKKTCQFDEETAAHTSLTLTLRQSSDTSNDFASNRNEWRVRKISARVREIQR